MDFPTLDQRLGVLQKEITECYIIPSGLYALELSSVENTVN